MSGTVSQGTPSEKQPGERRRDAPVITFLKIATGVMGVMILAGIGVLGLTIASRMSGPSDAPPIAAPVPSGPVDGAPVAFGDISVQLPPRARVVDVTMDGRRLVLHLQLAGREQLLIVFDLADGRKIGTVRLLPDSDRP